ncbi:hypothetical protein HK104_001440 [Borealophlyctis nickersoniae]|nr:hypothetical protein HK104_001440 [Borealophlyctis nickersoniae]
MSLATGHRSSAANAFRVAVPRRVNHNAINDPLTISDQLSDDDPSASHEGPQNDDGDAVPLPDPSAANPPTSPPLSSITTSCESALQSLELLHLHHLQSTLSSAHHAYLAQHQHKLLASRERYLASRLSTLVQERRKEIEATYFGWKHPPWDVESDDIGGDWWKCLKSVENCRVRLEDPEVAEAMFAELERYAKIMRKMGTKSAEIRASRAAALAADTKPFTFLVDDERKAREACRCRSKLDATITTCLREIKANQANHEADIRSHLSTATPPRLVVGAAEDGRRRREKILENESKAGLTPNHTFKPAINHKIPDYGEEQLRFRAGPQPFAGVEQHEKDGSKLTKLRRHSAGDAAARAGKRKAEAGTLTQPGHGHTRLPRPRDTHSSRLKVQHRLAVRESMELVDKMQAAQMEEKRERLQGLAQKIRSRIQMDDNGRSQVLRERRERFLEGEAQRERDAAYRQQLEDMEDRLKGKLCLFEQTEVFNAKVKAKTDFNQIIAEAGLKVDEFVSDTE